jgi:histone-lysine N-methyltransferase SETMAR
MSKASSEDEDYKFSMPSSTITPKEYETRASTSLTLPKAKPTLITMSKMDFYDCKVIVHYNYGRGLTLDSCYEEMKRVYKSLIPEKETVQGWYEKLKKGIEIRELKLGGGPHVIEGLESKIAELIEKNPYYSLRRMEIILGHSKHTIKKILEEKLNLHKVSTRWVPHILSPDQMQARVEIAEMMKKKLLKVKKLGFINLITGDESWFFLNYPPKLKWIKKGQSPPIAQNPKHFSQKVMLTLCFSANGLQVCYLLPEGKTMNASLFIENVLTKAEKALIEAEFPPEVPCIIHYDNAKIHTCSKTCEFLSGSILERLPHPPYSPDISPCDYFLL